MRKEKGEGKEMTGPNIFPPSHTKPQPGRAGTEELFAASLQKKKGEAVVLTNFLPLLLFFPWSWQVGRRDLCLLSRSYFLRFLHYLRAGRRGALASKEEEDLQASLGGRRRRRCDETTTEYSKGDCEGE